MKNIEIKDYSVFCDEENFISPLVIARVIISSVGFYSFHELYRICRKAHVDLTDDEIKRFLDSRIKAEYPELEQRMENYKGEAKPSTKERAQHTMDLLFLSGRIYEPYTLKYFKRYISILKNKCSILFEIFDSISKIYLGVMDFSNGNDMDAFLRLEGYLKKYDIYMREDGMLYYEDFLRLIDPFVFNVTKLLEMLKEANDLSTYLNFSISLDSIYRSGLNESDMYPSEELQDSHIETLNSDGYIVLSKRQEARKDEMDRRASQYFLNLIQ